MRLIGSCHGVEHIFDRSADQPVDQHPDQLASLTAVDRLAAQELDGLSDVALAQRVLALRRLLDRLEGQWLQTLAAVDGRGAAGADQGVQAPSTAGWLRNRLRLGRRRRQQQCPDRPVGVP